MKSENDVLHAVLDWLEVKGFYVDRPTLIRDWNKEFGTALPTKIERRQGHITPASSGVRIVESDAMPEDTVIAFATTTEPDGTVTINDAAILKGFKRV